MWPELTSRWGRATTVTPDILNKGAYFAEFSGTSGGSKPIHVAVDGTVTALATPEPQTWAMMIMGFLTMAALGFSVRARTV